MPSRRAYCTRSHTTRKYAEKPIDSMTPSSYSMRSRTCGASVCAVALRRALVGELAQVADLGVALGHREARQDRLAELDLDVRPLRDPQRVVARLGHLGEERRASPPPTSGSDPIAVELEAVRLVDLGVGLHAEQRVVRLGVVLVRVVAVVGGEQRRLELRGRSRSAAGSSGACSGRPWSCSSMKRLSRPKMSWSRAAASSAPGSSSFSSRCSTWPPRQPVVAMTPSWWSARISQSTLGFW